MNISDRDRKILWGNSGQQCALCRQRLVIERGESDRESVVGDEAHIVARSPGGPRYRSMPSAQVDQYENRILLCKVHHKVVDDQPREYPEERLQQIKRDHEAWVRERLSADHTTQPIRLTMDPADRQPVLLRLTTGSEVWRTIAGCHSFCFDAPDEDDRFSADQSDAADEFLDFARDYAEISSEVTDDGRQAVRAAKRELDARLSSLHEMDLDVFGCRRRRRLEGGVGEPLTWWESFLVALPRRNALIETVTLVPVDGSNGGFLVVPGEQAQRNAS